MQTGARSSPVRGDGEVQEEVQEIARRANLVGRNVGSVILGKEEVIASCVVALLAGGHVIIEDYPGVGKTLLAKALARSVGGRFSRIQFTPDLLPSDVTGVSVFDQKSAGFEFRPGPIFANVVLADEINRSSPKTQASLLECMEEGQATVDNVAHTIVAPFMILATQNPIEYEGTYPLPEAQLDRFMMRLSLGYPSSDAEEAILDSQTTGDPFAALEPVISSAEVLAMQEAVLRVDVAPSLRRYVVELLAATRASGDIYLGASPRAGIALLRAAKALAVLRGRDFVVPQDLKDLAVRVLSHRIILSPRRRHPSSRRGSGDRPAPRGRSDTGAGAMTRPTPRGAALVAVAVATYVAARILGTWELYVVALAFTAMVCVSWGLVAAGGRRLQVGRGVTPTTPVAGDPLLFSFRVKSGLSLPGLQVTLYDATGGLHESDRPVEVESLGARSGRTVSSTPWPARRGVHRLPAPLAVAEDPLGLVRTRRRIGEELRSDRRATTPGALLLRPVPRLGHASRRRPAAAAHARRLGVPRHPPARTR